MDRSLNINQLRMLTYIKKYIELRGYSPSLKEIRSAIGLKSDSTIHSHLKALEKKGYIKKDPTKPRSLTITEITYDEFKKASNKYHVDLSKIPGINPKILNGVFGPYGVNRDSISIYKNHMGDIASIGIFNGDYVMIDTSRRIANNDIILAIVNKEHYTINRFFKDDNTIKLACEDGNEEFITVNSKKVKILGVVIGFFRDFV
ncbi:S24 family peptidase [Romboutsia sp.]|uniref:LexA family protein n=1 Tax=Romboutsia sp. TaxID=1965302 RepID=UPI003F3D503D